MPPGVPVSGYPAVVIRWRRGIVTEVRREWTGAAEIMVTVDDPSRGAGGTVDMPSAVRALAYPALTGRPRPGDRVLLNTTALHQGLGTGGEAPLVGPPPPPPPRPRLPPPTVTR